MAFRFNPIPVHLKFVLVGEWNNSVNKANC